MTIKSILKDRYKKWENNPYIHYKENGKLVIKNYGDFVRDSIYLATGLKILGLWNQKIMIYGENSYEWMISDVAITGFTGISVAVSREWKYHDLDFAIQKVQPQAIIYSESKREVIEEVKKNNPQIQCLSMQTVLPQIINLGRKVKRESNLFDIEETNYEECSKIIFSSGTTDLIKAVMLSQKNIFFGYDEIMKRMPVCEKDLDYFFLPLHHIYAMKGLFYFSFISGMNLYLCSDIKRLTDEIREVNPTVFRAVPFIYERFYQLSTLNHRDLKSMFGNQIKYLTCGGAFLDKKLKQYYYEQGLPIMEGYGMTEIAGSMAFQNYHNYHINSQGEIYDGLEVKIVNPDENGVGEIAIKGDSVFLGYYNDLESTKQVIDANGFYYTNDIGYIHENNLYYIKRKDRMIILSNGENVNPLEIEEYIKKYFSIDKVVVYREDDHLVARIYPDEGVVEENLLEQINQQLPRYKQLKKCYIKGNSDRWK